jgi:thiol-disulfide isomerase/thioredoxin
MQVYRLGMPAVLAILLLAPSLVPAGSGRAEWSASDLAGKRVHLRDYRGRLVVLNFWATWCGACNAEMPLLVDAEKEYGPRGVAFIGASLDDSKTKQQVPEFISKYRVGFPVWLGATGDDLAHLRMGEAVPATAFVDRDGHVIARVSGQLREPELRERIEWLLGERVGAAPRPFVSHMEQEK